MTYKEIVREVSKETGLTQKFVNKVYRAYWKAIRQHICSLPLMEDLSDEEFLKLQPNVNIPSIGKLNVTLDRYKLVKQGYKKGIERRKNNVAHKEDKAS
jgi:hypothetical protein